MRLGNLTRVEEKLKRREGEAEEESRRSCGDVEEELSRN